MNQIGLGMLGDPVTPVIKGITALGSQWPGILSIAAVDFIGEYVEDMAPRGSSTAATLIYRGVQAAGFIVKQNAFMSVNAAYPARV